MIYDLVDAAFGVKRSPAVYDWLYRRNPYGTARCWVAFDRSSGRLLSSLAGWPWPMARGTQAREGLLWGDWATAPGMQRQGISLWVEKLRRSHP